MWNLTGGALHVTDPSNASRTMLFNLQAGSWDEELLGVLEVPREVLPEVRDYFDGLQAAGAKVSVLDQARTASHGQLDRVLKITHRASLAAALNNSPMSWARLLSHKTACCIIRPSAAMPGALSAAVPSGTMNSTTSSSQGSLKRRRERRRPRRTRAGARTPIVAVSAA